MRRRTLLLSLVCSACTTDLIDHALGTDGSIATDGAVPDSGFADAGAEDAAPTDAEGMDASGSCRLSATPIPVSAPETLVGESGRVAVQIANHGAGDCSIAGFTTSPPDTFGVVNAPATPLLLASGFFTSITIEFTPVTAGPATGTLLVAAGDAALTVTLSGIGLDPNAVVGDVTFSIENTTTEDRYLVTAGMFCTSFDPGVPTQLGFSCGCECPQPPDPYATQMVRIAPGERYEVTWDGRALDIRTETLDCGGGFTVQVLRGEPEKVAFGSYTLRMPFARSVPSNCSPGNAAGEYFCNGSGGLGSPPEVAEICPTEAVATSTYTIQTAGDLTVTVAIVD